MVINKGKYGRCRVSQISDIIEPNIRCITLQIVESLQVKYTLVGVYVAKHVIQVHLTNKDMSEVEDK